MTAGRSRRRWHRWVLLAVALAATAGPSVAASQLPVVRFDVPADPIKTGENVSVPVVIDGVTNLGAFSFQVGFDPAVLELDQAETGPFLGSSGREVECLSPSTTDRSVRLVCLSLGASPAGPDGSGVLATLTFKPVASGTSPLRFEELTLADPPAERIPAQSEDAVIAVGDDDGGGGFAWALWGPIIGVGALALGAAAASVVWRARRSRGL